MVCLYCGKNLISNKKYCNNECRYNYWRHNPDKKKLYELTCKYCEKQFETSRKTRFYCSRKCSNKVNANKKRAFIESHKLQKVWSCGGGVDSTAIAALIVQGKLPKPDYAIMVDCGWESEACWDYVYNVIQPELRKVGVNLEIIKTTDYSNNDIIVDGHLVLPAYKLKDSEVVKYKTHCNAQWKGKVVSRWLREKGVKHCESWIGVAIDEIRRVRRSPRIWNKWRYPLVELKLTREDCMYMIGAQGWPQPKKTSCIICPQRDDRAWANLKKNFPADWAKACEVDRMIRQNERDVYLHRSMKPLSDVEFKW